MSWRHFSDTTPKAQKDFQCYLCERTIPKGEVHRCRRGANEDGMVVMRMHQTCVQKTRDWDQSCWESHDAGEFRYWELEEGVSLIEEDNES